MTKRQGMDKVETNMWQVPLMHVASSNIYAIHFILKSILISCNKEWRAVPGSIGCAVKTKTYCSWSLFILITHKTEASWSFKFMPTGGFIF